MPIYIVHVGDLGHRLRVLFDKVHFVREGPVDLRRRDTDVILFWVVVQRMCARWDVGRWSCVRIPWKNLSECVTHLQLSIECSVCRGLIWI